MSTLKLAIQQRNRLARTLETRAQREMEMLATALRELAQQLLRVVETMEPSAGDPAFDSGYSVALCDMSIELRAEIKRLGIEIGE